MYSIEIHSNVYRQWRVWSEWISRSSFMVPRMLIMFDMYCVNHYPGVLKVHVVDYDVREFVFESEEHYVWFLLQQ